MGSEVKVLTIEGSTRIVGIIGDPVDHSISPRMHNAAFAELGLDFAYVPFPTSASQLRAAMRSISALGLAGFNVTVPFKTSCMRYLDKLSDAAKTIGAVNTVYREKDKLVGDNTDASGFHQALLANGVRPRGKRVLVIGAGGSARAVLYALTRSGASDIVIANRTLSKARKLAREFGGEKARLQTADLDILDDFDFLESRQLVVNCTSVGLGGGSFLDYAAESTAEDCVHFDLAYGEEATPFLRLAADASRPVIDGRHMLLHQGAAAFKIFTGRRAPVEVMAKAIGL